MLQVPATTLNTPKPVYGKGSASVSNGSWNLRDVKFMTTFPKFVFKVFMIAIPDGSHSAIKGPEILQETFKGFQDVMQRSYSTATIQLVGMCPDPQFDRGEAEARISMEKAKAKGANFVMLFLEKANTPAYSVFKHLADCTYGMHSLCVVYKGKPFSPQYWGNIAMKMNLKAGGINHSVDGVEQIMKDTLVLGA
jgi:eukaryotic translation initiation factor 2C